MKKSLVLAMALAMGVTASAYAANPFSDVPAGHWAYDAVDKLAAAGVVDGMGDGTFNGDKTMTRYEMAQIVAKAMAKGANVEKLAAEFADELDQLGVRVAKLEKKSDNVTITGQIRYEYFDHQMKDRLGDKDDASSRTHRFRTRLFLNGQVNEDWAYHARIQNDQNFDNNTGDNDTKMNRAYVTGKIGGVKVSAGRQQLFLADGNIFDDTADALIVSYGKKVKVSAYAAKPNGDTGAAVSESKDIVPGQDKDGKDAAASLEYQKAYGVAVESKFGVMDARIGYDTFRDAEGSNLAGPFGWNKNSDAVGGNNSIWNVKVGAQLGKLYLSGTYLKASNDYDTLVNGYDPSSNGYVFSVKYGGAQNAKVGSWGAYANYYHQGAGTFVKHTMNGAASNYGLEGFKGYYVGADYTIAKNILALVEWYDLKGLESDVKTQTLMGRVQFSF